jgi:hypothetical protein
VAARSSLHPEGPPDQPEWLDHVNASVLKSAELGDHWNLIYPPAAHVHPGGDLVVYSIDDTNIGC